MNHFSSVGFGHTKHYGHIFEGTSGILIIRAREYAPVYMCRSVVCKAGDLKRVDFNADLRVDGWIILGWISRRWDVGMWTGLGWPRTGTGGGPL